VFAAKHRVHPLIQERPLKDANQVVIDMEKGNARYRYVLVNEKHAAEEKA
jgi:D-arabinose 1-dehydrogenase-like Zn-dependent alcohol dehydrogenase